MDTAEKLKTRVIVGEDRVYHGATYEAPSTFASMGLGGGMDLGAFEEGLTVDVKSVEDEGNELVFDMVGVDAPLANTMRRILLSEVPTMAIEIVQIENNTSVLQDEVLAHRLGLIPIKVDPALFDVHDKHGQYTPNDSLVFDLNVTAEEDESGALVNSKVFSGSLEYVPIRDLGFAEPPRVVHSDIVIAKLAKGQTINVRCYATKGTGKIHAKWSPVATASYRLMPEPAIVKTPSRAEAKRLASLCPTNVFDIEDSGALTVARPRHCTVCRECIRAPPDVEDEAAFEPAIELRRIKNHFIFSVESTGILPSERLVHDAFDVLKARCDMYLAKMDEKSLFEDAGTGTGSDDDDDDDDDNDNDDGAEPADGDVQPMIEE